jgi:hypothetical protein
MCLPTEEMKKYFNKSLSTPAKMCLIFLYLFLLKKGKAFCFMVTLFRRTTLFFGTAVGNKE